MVLVIVNRCCGQFGTSGPLSVGELFDTGGLSALCGGTTTTLSFCQQMAGVSLATAIADYRAKTAKATTDYGFHIV